MKFRVDGLGFFGSRQYDTLEEARANIYDKKGRKGNIIVEMSEKEYLEILRQKDLFSQKIITLQQELESVYLANQKFASEINSLKSQQSQAKENIAALERRLDIEQQKSIRYENEIKTLSKFIPKSKVNIGPKEITHNPYACGLTFHRITPSPKDRLKTVELTERSQILMNHISRCPAVTNLSVQRLLGCGRKSARSILNKMWLGGYLECVGCLTETSTFKLYYLPGSCIEIHTPNQVCQLAVLSLLYATLATNTNTFRNLSFEIVRARENRMRGSIDLKVYVALLSFVHVRRQNDKTIEKSYEFYVMPFRKNEKVRDISSKGTGFYILPLKNIEEAEKIVKRGCAYTIDDNLLKNNFVEKVYYKQ